MVRAEAQDPRFERRIGDVRGSGEGPLFVATGGLHGNEPAGVHALRRVFERFRSSDLKTRLRGRFVGMAGNLEALRQRVRFVDLDLNRAWSRDRVARIRAGAERHLASEDREQSELLSAFEGLFAEHAGPAYCIDLHTISAPGAPFATLGDTLKNRDFAMGLPVVKLLGIEEQIEGALLEWLNRQGHVTLGFEGGQHDDPASVDRHEAFVWLALEKAGSLQPEDVPDRQAHLQVLNEARRGAPQIVEVWHRHAVAPDDGFRMEPGFRHFQPVDKGTVLARDRKGPVTAPESSILLFPLYQGQGDDGFFLGRRVHPLWLGVSRVLRQSGVPRLAHWLPGVRRKDGDPATVLVDPRIARAQSVGVFHLLGYRRIRRQGPILEFTRRLE